MKFLRYGLINMLRNISLKITVLILIIIFSVLGCTFKKKVKILMVLWRGETFSEKGFKNAIESLEWETQFEIFNADQDLENLEKYLDNTDFSKFDIIYTFGTTVTKSVLKRNKEVPIVFSAVSDPVKQGIIKSWEKPGENITGTTTTVKTDLQIEMIQKIIKPSRIAVLYNERESNSVLEAEDLKRSAERYDILVDIEIGKISSLHEEGEAEMYLEAAAARISENNFDLVYLPSDSYLISKSEILGKLLKKYNLKSYGNASVYMKNGILFGLVPSYRQMGEKAAHFAVRIINGEKAGEIATDYMPLSSLELLVNKNTLTDLELTLPENLDKRPTWVLHH